MPRTFKEVAVPETKIYQVGLCPMKLSHACHDPMRRSRESMLTVDFQDISLSAFSPE